MYCYTLGRNELVHVFLPLLFPIACCPFSRVIWYLSIISSLLLYVYNLLLDCVLVKDIFKEKGSMMVARRKDRK
jgi:hypothetical protein